MERSKKDDLESIWDKRVEILGTKEKKGFHSNQDVLLCCYCCCRCGNIPDRSSSGNIFTHSLGV